MSDTSAYFSDDEHFSDFSDCDGSCSPEIYGKCHCKGILGNNIEFSKKLTDAIVRKCYTEKEIHFRLGKCKTVFTTRITNTTTMSSLHNMLEEFFRSAAQEYSEKNPESSAIGSPEFLELTQFYVNHNLRENPVDQSIHPGEYSKILNIKPERDFSDTINEGLIIILNKNYKTFVNKHYN
ncbi:hypothetical protein COEREDRAFT_85980 [Coemansia reversa NRRL 1564]|uniref:Uncharacterized protein n=1 Tax=Coemansia reversa (strain ATCC 12441 / NRRL 1564) TaxID=763665 RepID=A0A2G5BFF7_COERN|nr:hypothetical protein COEREDRAFT_85980 [Coemansia reversa NRRL 1564]|eukprot:PIA17712.1 hypothetical protein COEREDRAFT_85980 [Coemansia reversa NRRL 1564]